MIDLKDLEGVVWYGGDGVYDLMKTLGVSVKRWRGEAEQLLYTVYNGEVRRVDMRGEDSDYIYTEELKNAPIVDIIEWAKSKEKPCPEEKSNPDEEEEIKYILYKGGEVFIGALKECQDIVKDNLWWEGADVYSKTGSVSISVSLQ